MMKHRDISLNRVDHFKGKHQLQGALYTKKADVQLSHWPAPGRVSFAEATETGNEYQKVEAGEALGPVWSTHWIRLELSIPSPWIAAVKAQESAVLLQFDFGGEVLVWSAEGAPLQGMNGQSGEDRRDTANLLPGILSGTQPDQEGNIRAVLFLECACNELFGNSKWQVGPTAPDPGRSYSIKSAGLVLRSNCLWKLWNAFTVITDIAKHQDEDSYQARHALAVANDICNVCHLDDPTTFAGALQKAQEYFRSKEAALGSGMELSAIGHCHIDTAWLWPYDETKRKCARSWGSQLRLMECYPSYKFTCSQAQQLDWLQSGYPILFDELVAKSKTGNFIPVGGTWVEMDCNIPSGESLARQFLYGQKFFLEHFGKLCTVFWLPDTFGYAAQLPQIMLQAGVDAFLTQKLSWNQVNKFPHNTFLWQGIDGSTIPTHFPPADTYCSHANVKDVHFSETNNKDKERTKHAMLVFGHGDGGGGPNEKMLEMLQCMKDGVGGLPSVVFRDPASFFALIAEDRDRLCTWAGELYFEYHRGTYTTQASTKLYNRRCEDLLRVTEMLATVASFISTPASYTHTGIEEAWKLVLLNQFHDVIPGTSIHCVYEDAAKFYEQAKCISSSILSKSLSSLSDGHTASHIRNLFSFSRLEVLSLPGSDCSLALVSAEPFSIVSINDALQKGEQFSVSINSSDRDYIIQNDVLRATITFGGCITSLLHKASGKEALAGPGNRFVLFDDHPLYWDAWDVDAYHLEKMVACSSACAHEILTDERLRAEVRFTYKISTESSIVQTVRLDAASEMLQFHTTVDWHESHKFLKVQFPLNIRSASVTYEVPFGAVERPTHVNTSWDMAKFEVCGHRFADMSEYDFGCALLNDCKYGYSARGNLLALSLLRSPKAPDDTADMGTHQFSYALLPHSGSWQAGRVLESAIRLNSPLQQQNGGVGTSFQFLSIDQPSVFVSAFKRPEDRSKVDTIVIRMYEAFGGSCDATCALNLPGWKVAAVSHTNILENIVVALPVGSESSWTISFKPFEICTIALHLTPVR